MKHYFFTIISTIAVALGLTPATQAAKPVDIGLNFDLAPRPTAATHPAAAADTAKTPEAPLSQTGAIEPLKIPQQGASIPVGASTQADSSAQADIATALPPPPSVEPALAEPDAASVAVEPQPVEPQLIAPQAVTDVPDAVSSPAEPQSLSISADAALPALEADSNQPAAIEPRSIDSAATQSSLAVLFEGDSHSLVARAVGSAEGTRTPDGGKTWAYQGHTDPGNGVWNLGTFSYQHGANSPEAADRKQLRRLMGQAQALRQDAAERGIQLTLEEELNGIDLANQSPRAALSRGGYMDRLKQAHDMGLQDADAILWARTRAFLDPDTDRWNAPGLGNNVHSITADQERRRAAIARAIDASPQIAAASTPIEPLPIPRREERVARSPEDSIARPLPESIADYIISLDLPPT
jgi:hypothetical protein